MTLQIARRILQKRVVWIRLRQFTTVSSSPLSKTQNEVSRNLRSRIKALGPITVADYMKEVLVNPSGGYYMHKDVFGEEGDFITSPELGQVFGEMIAIWFLNEWSKAGSPKPLQIVELGPGRGTLTQDILRVFTHFRVLKQTSVHLVEVSPFLAELQRRRLCMPPELDIAAQKPQCEKTLAYHQGVNTNGVSISWYKDLSDVPNCFTLLVAHEFFDALPIHKFHKTDDGYHEVLVDIDEKDPMKFKYIISRGQTPTGRLFIKKDEARPHLEISPHSLKLAEQISKRVETDGGLALLADYGHNGEGTDTFRAFKNHKLHDPLLEPGSADLTADVDFARIKETALTNEVLAYGPITQKDFLFNMGMEHRVNLLKQKATKEQVDGLEFGYRMMTEPEQMGTRFKFLALLPRTLKPILDKYPITGFTQRSV